MYTQTKASEALSVSAAPLSNKRGGASEGTATGISAISAILAEGYPLSYGSQLPHFQPQET
ncbi:hypothetical protein CVT26_004068 [Gymnopilus dilepis]|uniref:Uncharacterized protein n=1 Tax=Gymnopilus dilepis TaxID=231916 RepID=A0A409YMM6_9AGAR|nr:hypothetical protein CVT26_004068 [Gymnopilus dilepis]